MRLAISRHIDRELNYSALWIGCRGLVIIPVRNQSRALGGDWQFTGGGWGCHPEIGTDQRFGREDDAVCTVG